jgi:hypothetical protein
VDTVRRVAQAVLYEGYLLWPYRRSALKNQRRWTFGGVYPQPYSTAGHDDDPWMMRTECLLEGDDRGTVDVTVRFLQVVRRDVGRLRDGELELVDELTVGDERHLAFQEAVEREVGAPGLSVAGLLRAPRRVEIDIAAGASVDPLADPADPAGGAAGAVVRSWNALRGCVETGAERVAPDVYRLAVTITNTTGWSGRRHEEAVAHALISTHTVLHARGGRFVSLMDPPDALKEQAAACRNVKTWPVLIGEEGERHTLLSSPIIMYDYPRVAPESPGDLFDATEIDQLLTLSTMALSDEERRELRDTDPRARALLDRCASLAPEQLMRLHGTFRDVRALPDGRRPPA